MKVFSVILLLLFTTPTTKCIDSELEKQNSKLLREIPRPFLKYFTLKQLDYFVATAWDIHTIIRSLLHVTNEGYEDVISFRRDPFYLSKLPSSANKYGLYKEIIEQFLNAPHGYSLDEQYKFLDSLVTVMINNQKTKRKMKRKSWFKLPELDWWKAMLIVLKPTSERIFATFGCEYLLEEMRKLSKEKLAIILEVLTMTSRMDQKTLDYLLESVWRIEIPDKKEVQVREIRWYWHTFHWAKYDEYAVVFLQSVEPNLHILTGKLTLETLESLSTENFRQENKDAGDLLKLGCGELEMDLSSILGKFTTNFLESVNWGNGMKTLRNREEDELNNSDFQTAFEIFDSYDHLKKWQQQRMRRYLRKLEFFGARTFLTFLELIRSEEDDSLDDDDEDDYKEPSYRYTMPSPFLQKMKTIDGKINKTTVSSVLREIRSCTRRTLSDILVMANAWRSGIETKEAVNRLRAHFESSKCDMLKEVSSERQEKAIQTVVGVLEDSFGFVSCKKKRVEKVEVKKTSEAVEEFVESLSNTSVVSDHRLFNALSKTSYEQLKTSAKFAEGCLNLMKLEEAPFKISAILNSMPEPELLQALNSNRSWSELSKLSQSALNLLHKFERLKVAEQEQLVQHHPMLQQLSDARHSLLDLTSCATRLAACGRLEEFLEVLSIWRLGVASEEARTRVLRLLEVSSCEVVDELASGREQVDKLVALLDKYFGTESCVAKMAQEDRSKHYRDFK